MSQICISIPRKDDSGFVCPRLSESLNVISCIQHIDKGDLDYVVDEYLRYLSIPTYLFFDIDGEMVGKLIPKKGNISYRNRFQKQLFSRLGFLDAKETEALTVHREGRGFYSHALFFTLTLPNLSIASNWKTIQLEYNRWAARIRYHYGKVFLFKVFESTERGYPHIHVLAIFDQKFKVYHHRNRKGEKSVRLSYPVDKAKLEKFPGHVDIQAVTPKNSHVLSACGYLLKDFVKSYSRGIDRRTRKDVLSLAMTTIYRKRAFSLSKEKILKDIVNRYCIKDDLVEKSITQSQKAEKNAVVLGLVNYLDCDHDRPPDFLFYPKKHPMRKYVFENLLSLDSKRGEEIQDSLYM